MRSPIRPRRPHGAVTALGALAAALAAAGSAHAGGFYLQEQSVKGLGRAYSGEASDVGAEGLWWNPAAIAQVKGVEIVNGFNAISVDAKSDDAGSTVTRPGQAPAPVGGEPRAFNPVIFGVAPDFDAAWRINEHFAVGLAVSTPFNFTTKYAPTSWARYQSEKSLLFNLDVQPTLAVHVNKYLDLGVSFDAEYTSATLTNALPNISPLLPDGRQSLTGDGWNYGYTIGAQIHPLDTVTVGLSYRSSIDQKLDGRIQVNGLEGTPYAALATVDAPGRADFSTPWFALIGVRWQATERLALNAQVEHFGWSEFDAIRVSFGSTVQATPQSYKDTTSAAFGVDYAVTPKWTVRGGVQYDPTPTPDVGRTVRVPDADRFLFTVGTTIRPNPRLALDLAGGYIDFQNSRVNSTADAFAGTPLVTPVDIQGQVSGSGAVLSVGARAFF